MAGESISQEFSLKKYSWNKKLFCWRNKSKWIIDKKHEKVCTTLNYI